MAQNKMKRKCEKDGLKPKKLARPIPKAMKAAQERMEVHHHMMKERAAQLWSLIVNPVFGSPTDPEEGFPSEATAIAKRGRRCAFESVFLG